MTYKPFPSLHTDRLVLDELQDDDHADIYKIFSSQKAMAHYDMERLTTPSEGMEIVNFLREKFTKNIGVRWAIREISSKARSFKNLRKYIGIKKSTSKFSLCDISGL